jgi:hypothetical protein
MRGRVGYPPPPQFAGDSSVTARSGHCDVEGNSMQSMHEAAPSP